MSAQTHTVSAVTKADYPALIELWEASVRATHHFLTEEWIVEHKPLILNQYFDLVALACIRTAEGEIMGFLGTAEGNIEMLFVSPSCFKKGVGQALIKYAVNQQNAQAVDVNEDNPGARAFYERMGFEVLSRSELDGQGNPYPILHMKLKTP